MDASKLLQNARAGLMKDAQAKLDEACVKFMADHSTFYDGILAWSTAIKKGSLGCGPATDSTLLAFEQMRAVDATEYEMVCASLNAIAFAIASEQAQPEKTEDSWLEDV